MITGTGKARSRDPRNLAGSLSQLYKSILKLISSESTRDEVLQALCQFMEAEYPDMLCSVLLLDAEGGTLRQVVAPSLPMEYSRSLGLVKVGPQAGSCGTAAYRSERVIVEDISSDPLWQEARDSALRHGLKACWSTPILSRSAKVLGTFAVYYREPRQPDNDHLQIVDCATHLASIAIEREHTRHELRAVETRYRALVERLPAITYIAEVGAMGRWHYVSPQIQSMLGFSPEEWLANSTNWINHIHPEDRNHALEAEKRFWEIGGIFRAEYRMLARDGRLFWFRDDAVYLQTGNSQNPIMQGVLYDITEYKLLEEQLRHSQKMEAVGQLAGGVAHDFNNLLMIIRAHSDRILNGLSSDNEAHKDATEIKHALDRATSLTRQLLAFSRKQVLQPRLLDINGIVADVGKMLHRLLGDNIRVRLSAASPLPCVKVDQGQLEQVILNLALNARDAMPQGGELKIETQAVQVTEPAERAPVGPGSYVLLKLSDTGVGMDADTQRHIFEPFFSTKELGKGTGLGLASVYGVVKQSGGGISFSSQLGHGTTFFVYLPEATESRVSDNKELPALPRSKGSETLLVVEDEDEIRDMVGEYLQRHGYTVLNAKNGQEALEIALRYRGLIHLVITDVVMPQLGGRELAEEIRRMRPRTKVLFTSGYLDDSVECEADDGRASHLQKPFALGALGSKVRE